MDSVAVPRSPVAVGVDSGSKGAVVGGGGDAGDYRVRPHAIPYPGMSDGVEGTLRGPPA
jgi:hypothetical protein